MGPIACGVLFFVLALVCEGTYLSQEIAVSTKIKASSTVSRESSSRITTPNSALTSNVPEALNPSASPTMPIFTESSTQSVSSSFLHATPPGSPIQNMLPPVLPVSSSGDGLTPSSSSPMPVFTKPPILAPTSNGPPVQGMLPSVLHVSPPYRLPSGYGGSNASYLPIPPTISGDISPSSLIFPSPPLASPTEKGDNNGSPPINTTPGSTSFAPVSSPSSKIPLKPPVVNPSITAPPPYFVGPHIKDYHTPATSPVNSIGVSNHVPAVAPPTPVKGYEPVSSPNIPKSFAFPSVAPGVIFSHSPFYDHPPASAPTHTDGNSAPVISPLSSLSPKAVPINHNGHQAPPPIAKVPPVSENAAPGPLPSHVSRTKQRHGAINSPVVSPSGSLHLGSGNPSLPPTEVLAPSSVGVPQSDVALPPSLAPSAPTELALPPQPPILDCTTFACTDPYTNSPPGYFCACVRPMKVELRLDIALYTFFPLVSELAQQVASGTSMNQSQVRIMGANAATEQIGKTIVLVDLVPQGKVFDKFTALSTALKFWNKQVGIKTSSFGNYDVLYVTYPGLPPPPPMPPANVYVNGGNGNKSRRIHPLGVDVRKKREKLNASLIAIIALSSVTALVLFVGATCFLFSKILNGGCLSRHAPLNDLPLFSKASGSRKAVLGAHPSSASGSFNSSIVTYTGTAKTFTVAEIEKATDKFKDSNIIGEGGFGLVYQGILEDGTKVAVKVLKRDDQQGNREFFAEVDMLSRLHHRNLVKLIGICSEEHLRCLIYELIPNGSMDSHLHGSDKEITPLDWGTRLKIGLGSARGLAYLHEDSSPRVIHRDFKSSNILLDCDFTPKVSDFGLARTAAYGEGHISTRVMGTFGYVAPEYAMTGHLLVKSDVYSYGVVLLELLTGRKPVDMLRPPGQENLVTWARPLLTSREGLEAMIDPALGSNIPFDSVAKVAAIASMCVQPEVSHRPFMGEVVQALKLVCNESDEHIASGRCSQDDVSNQDPELRINTCLDRRNDRVLSASEIFNSSATGARDLSGSFTRHSSSGPLTPSKTGVFWQKLRGLSMGNTSEHGFALGSRSTEKECP